jgi:tetratricopeptide (TPR) repeat protein
VAALARLQQPAPLPPPPVYACRCAHGPDVEAARPDFDQALRLERQGDFRASLLAYTRALKLDPACPSAWYHRAKVLDQLHRYPAADADYARALELQPGFAAVYNGRAYVRVHQRGADLQACLRDAQRAVELAPSAAFYDTRGCVYLRLKDGRAALADFDRAFHMDGTGAAYYAHRAQAYRLLGNSGRALQDDQEATRQGAPRSLEPYERVSLWDLP